MSVPQKASQQIEVIAMEALNPVINQERYDLIIKMAEGFHALTLKGYPGAQKFLNELFDLLGERFQTDFTQDEQERLQLQATFLKSLKKPEFYQKKLAQFTAIPQPKEKREDQIEEKLATARSRYDSIIDEFKKISTDEPFLAALDTNGIAFITALDDATFRLSQLDDGKRVMKVIADTLPARAKIALDDSSKEPSFVMHLIAKVVKHLISNPLSKNKRNYSHPSSKFTSECHLNSDQWIVSLGCHCLKVA